jgi:pantetheine-phosphate adenylyltransferase
MKNEKTALYPGSFDPITYGHIDIIKRAVKLFDRVIVAVARNQVKSPLFTEQERMEMIRESVREIPQVEVTSFSGLLVDFARSANAQAVIRGLRAISDFEYEMQMALVNRKLDEHLVTVFLMPHEKYTYLNSSIVKELAKFGGEVSCFVPSFVREQLYNKLRNA